jgi:hypothetical protein
MRSASATGPARVVRQAGATIMEAAVVSLAFFVLVLGVIEIGLAMNDSLALASSVRAGARAASVQGNDVKADLFTMNNIAKESSALKPSDIVRIVVYKPTGFGQKPTTECMNGTPVADVCNVYTGADLAVARAQVIEEAAAAAQNRSPDPTKIIFGCKTSSPDRFWCPDTRKVSITGAGPDYVGVWIRIEHKWVTQFFGSAKTLEDQSVIRLEPRTDDA